MENVVLEQFDNEGLGPCNIGIRTIREEIKRTRLEIAHDIEEFESKYPSPTEETLGAVMTE